MDESHDKLSHLLSELTAIPALSGFEDPMIRSMKDRFGAYGTPEVDALGNVMLKLTDRKSPQVPRVMVFAHMDELGFIVRKIEADGYLRIERLGGVPEKSMSGQRVLVGTAHGEFVEGVVGAMSHHVTPQEEKYRVRPVKEAYLDLGFPSREAVIEAGIRVGSPVVYARSFARRGDRIFANALDNRVGCAVLLELAERIAFENVSPEVWLVASVQEEFSLRGVLPAARLISPDIAVCLDIAVAWDTPDLNDGIEVRLGWGPTLGTYSFHGRGTLAGVIPNPKLLDFFERTAEANGVETQRNVFFGGLTDASFLQEEQRGIPSIDIGFPCRYTHAPVESCSLSDISRGIDLLHGALGSMEHLDLTRG